MSGTALYILVRQLNSVFFYLLLHKLKHYRKLKLQFLLSFLSVAMDIYNYQAQLPLCEFSKSNVNFRLKSEATTTPTITYGLICFELESMEFLKLCDLI